jgi:hypothetical protein
MRRTHPSGRIPASLRTSRAGSAWRRGDRGREGGKGEGGREGGREREREGGREGRTCVRADV